MFSPDTLGLHSGHVLESAGSDEHHVVLLEVVTLARHIRGQLPTRGQPHQHTLQRSNVRHKKYIFWLLSYLSIRTVWLFRLLN